MRDRNAPLVPSSIADLDWDKAGGLIPAIVQDCDTLQVLMLGFMSKDALEATLRTGKVTFMSRSRNRLWEKGESSGNSLELRSIHADCDADALLVLAIPKGPTCHQGTISCFTERGPSGPGALGLLKRAIGKRSNADPKESYTARLLGEGVGRIAQKIGEEGVELALAAAGENKKRCISEAADFLYHFTILMEARGIEWSDLADELERRQTA